MGFWIFMLIMCLLFPVIMIVMGMVFSKAAPKDINYIYGYRTNMSMKNRDTWEFAHKYFGKFWIYMGIISLPISIIPMLFVTGGGESLVGTVGSIVTIVNLILLIIPIIPTEIALRKNFDKDGNKIR